MSERCKAILCTKNTSLGWCREHSYGHLSEAFGIALKPRIAELPGAEAEASVWDENDRGWVFKIPTRAGELRVTHIRDSYALYTTFEDPKRAKAVLGELEVNPWSGKWNHHFTDGEPVEKAVAYVMNQLKRVVKE